jgi:hypothetical protein
MTANLVGRSLTHAVIGPPAAKRLRSVSIGMNGKIAQFSVSRKVCIRLKCGIGMISVFRIVPSAATTS